MFLQHFLKLVLFNSFSATFTNVEDELFWCSMGGQNGLMSPGESIVVPVRHVLCQHRFVTEV